MRHHAEDSQKHMDIFIREKILESTKWKQKGKKNTEEIETKVHNTP